MSGTVINYLFIHLIIIEWNWSLSSIPKFETILSIGQGINTGITDKVLI